MPACNYEIERVWTRDGFESLRSEWRELYHRSEPRNPFLSYEWTRICRERLCAGSDLFILTARREGRLVAVAPLRRERKGGFRVLRFIGDGRSDYLGFLCDPDEPGAELALLNGLATERREWDLAVLRQLTDSYSGIHRTKVPEGLRGAEIEGTTAPYVLHPGDWETVLTEGPGWLKRMAKASRKFEKEGGSVERYLGSEALEHVAEVAEVESHSWKMHQGVARFQPGEGQELLREALQTLGGRGEMELWIGRMEGRPVAFEINFLTPRRIWLYQGAYNEAFRKFSPGGVLDFLSIRRAWEDGVREYDFLSGDEPYKAERTNAARSIRYRAFYPASPRGHLAFATLVAPRWHLKNSAHAKSALQFWVQLRNNPAALLPAPLVARVRAR